ncbi:MAG: proline--tRNA ligase [Janthinobacterium lividum]
MSKKLPTRQEDYSAWYNELVKRAGLAENSAVRGCMVIKPYGYAIWEKMQRTLDDMFKRTGHENAYFPIFIPKSLFEAEEKNAEGFAKECAVVTHYRLQTDPDRPGKLRVDPNAKLEEELVVRPTSEAIIWSTYKGWIQSYRDLPLLINQWANVVRWEMRTRLFLRTAEFLWQEGHTAHATATEAVAETRQMLDVYAEFAEEHLALPVVKGVKTPSERFAGAEDTYCIEALMQDGKALQAGTSHFLGQNFAKAFDVQFANKEGVREHVWGTSWGVSTRLMGALVMAHSDDDGLVLPPKLAPIQVVIVPIYKTGEMDALLERIRPIQQGLLARGISVKLDSRDTERPGAKFAEWELKGVPVRLAIGNRDLDAGTVEAARRDTKAKLQLPLAEVVDSVDKLLNDIQLSIYNKAKDYRIHHTTRVESYDEFKQVLDGKGGFVLAHYDGTAETEELIKEQTKATVRCLALNEPDEDGVCMVTGQPSLRRAWFARAY